MNNKEAIKVLSKSIHYGSKVPWDKIVEAVHLSIEALSQPSLPSDLDEAAEKWADDEDNTRGGDYISCAIAERAFKAGAEWMAGQGETFESTVSVNGMGDSYVDGYYLTEKIPEGEKVIVQIRKK